MDCVALVGVKVPFTAEIKTLAILERNDKANLLHFSTGGFSALMLNPYDLPYSNGTVPIPVQVIKRLYL